MTKPHPGGADEKSNQPEGESAAVRVQTDAASEQDAAEVHTTEPVEGEANEPEDAENTVGAEDIDQAEAAISDDADAEDEAEAAAAISDEADAEDEAQQGKPAKAKLRISWPRVLAYGVLPGLALVLAAAGGFLKWQDSSARAAQLARIESVAAAKDSTIALLSYKSDTVEKDLEAAKSRLTGTFKDSYSQLINDVVIPGAKRGHISTTATVPAAASVSATANHAVTLLFVNQTAVVDKDPPQDTVSSVRVTLDKVAGRWLISGFDPV
jgi:Mce-associated membrane protein